ncbi:kinase-like protein [Lentinus tigrinus ALCF2SS1-6]|uniref:Kinase-like protein n=1 Tax=Lentinus tigrinus ALCF2SS1-6 TaxID=1328759 RepID=A0A5C2RND7_9APHY|nr:kinase-like protein [Lentinus tigrinus ALCF2SS1-6]
MPLAAASLPNFAGRTIKGHYILTEKLGFGGWGVVYKAIDTRKLSDSPARHRAIKIMAKAGLTLKHLKAFRREVVLHVAVASHPNIITIHDAFADDEYLYIVLDYCPGGDLLDHIVANSYRSNHELLRSAFVSLLDAVQYCHEHKIAHRDLKPQNVLVSEDGSKVFLADFGLATAERMTEEHGWGTPTHMAPECHKSPFGKTPRYDTHAADVWALGVILMNMLTGRGLWTKTYRTDVFFMRFIHDPNYFYNTFPELSMGVCDILTRIFTLEPLERISVRKLREAILNLDTFLRSEESEEAQELMNTTSKKCGKSTLDMPDGAPGLSPASSQDDAESPLVTPEDTKVGMPKHAGVKKVEWKIAFRVQVLRGGHDHHEDKMDCD